MGPCHARHARIHGSALHLHPYWAHFPVRSSVPLTRDIPLQCMLTIKARTAWSVRALFLEFPYERESCSWPSVHARKGRFGHSRANTERLLLFGRVHRLPCMGALPLKTQPPFFTAYVPQITFLPSRRRVIWCDWYPNNHESEETVSCRWKQKKKKTR
jgi:hypothetical protein